MIRTQSRRCYSLPQHRYISSSPIPASSPSRNEPFARPGPPPLGDPKAQREIDELLKAAARLEQVDAKEGKAHPDAPKTAASEAWDGDKNPVTGEIGGPKGKEPTRYGDWERRGRVFDF
ncbi:hypothetical protein SeMB42_g01768 [Synchytrium endobioticum]|nr:hypothetical protein SeMB42_g01768 [Synchytrium endobioticum]